MSENSAAITTDDLSLISVGYTGIIRRLNESCVVKCPKDYLEDVYREMNLEMLDMERQIYERLGSHEGILPYYWTPR